MEQLKENITSYVYITEEPVTLSLKTALRFLTGRIESLQRELQGLENYTIELPVKNYCTLAPLPNKFISKELQDKLLHQIYLQEFEDITKNHQEKEHVLEILMQNYGLPIEQPFSEHIKENFTQLAEHVTSSTKWYTVFEFIERYLQLLNEDSKQEITHHLNKILRDENSDYRIIKNLILPVTNETELQILEKAYSMNLMIYPEKTLLRRPPREKYYQYYQPHFQTAAQLFSQKDKIDYHKIMNSLKHTLSYLYDFLTRISNEDENNETVCKLLNLPEIINKETAEQLKFFYDYFFITNNGKRESNKITYAEIKYMLMTISEIITGINFSKLYLKYCFLPYNIKFYKKELEEVRKRNEIK